MSRNRRSRALGRHRLTSWTVIRSTALWLPLLSNTNSLRSCTRRSSSACARRCSKANSIQLVVRGLKTTPTCRPARRSHGSSSMASATSSRASARGVALHGSQIVSALLARSHRSSVERVWVTFSPRSLAGECAYLCVLREGLCA